MKSKSRLFIITMFSRSVVIKSLKLSISVGTILNLINDWNFLLQQNFGNLSPVKIILTCFVPFAGSSYSISKTRMEPVVGNKLSYEVNLQCTTCNRTTVTVKSGELISSCDNCKERTSWIQID